MTAKSRDATAPFAVYCLVSWLLKFLLGMPREMPEGIITVLWMLVSWLLSGQTDRRSSSNQGSNVSNIPSLTVLRAAFGSMRRRVALAEMLTFLTSRHLFAWNLLPSTSMCRRPAAVRAAASGRAFSRSILEPV